MSTQQLIRNLGAARWSHLHHLHGDEVEAILIQVDPDIVEKFKSCLGMSDFVYRSIQKDPSILTSIASCYLQGATQANLTLPKWPVEHDQWLQMTEPQALQALRVYRHKVMTTLACFHVVKGWEIERVMRNLSCLADEFYLLARAWSVENLAPRLGRALDTEGQPVPLVALGMGKLGGYELNFSSDIDLIFCYPYKGTTRGGRREEDFQSYFTKLAQKIIMLLDSTTADGQVYRVDMRLRPFGDSGPLVSSFDALEDYYQEQGRDWERYALLKARPLQHDSLSDDHELMHHQTLEALLRPFVYRRYIDFSVIESLRTMKRQIRQEVKRRQLKHNIKLGEGGIREAEFIIQAMQMLRGGKEPQLQLTSFLKVLPELVTMNVFNPQEGHDIRAAYLLLRDVEQLLQAFNDQQTQTLPLLTTGERSFDELELDTIDFNADGVASSAAIAQARLCAFYDLLNWPAFLAMIKAASNVIHGIFNDVIGEDPSAENNDDNPYIKKWQQLWIAKTSAQSNDIGDANREQTIIDTETYEMLIENDENKTQSIPLFSQMNRQRDDLLKAVISSKGRDKLDILVPLLMAESERQSVSQNNVKSLLSIIKKVASRTTYLSLLIENPGALTQLVKLVSRCHFIGQQLTNFPLLLDQLIDPKLLYAEPKIEDYDTDLRRNLLRVSPDDLELQMEILRQFKLSSQLVVAACDVEGVIDLATESNLLTALAEAILKHTVDIAWRQMVERYGYPDGATDDNKQFAVIGYGKLGGFELAYGSDLDIVFVHDCKSTKPTDGTKAIDSRQFYLKLAQRILHIFTTRTPSGVLYDIDTRLRPSGASGLMAINIDTFAEYQQQEAWTWEHQALVRTRIVLGENALVQRFSDIRRTIIQSSRLASNLISDISSMRLKMFDNLASETPEVFDLKHSRGGIADIEFITQYLVLRYSNECPKLGEFSDNKRLFNVAKQHGYLSEDDAKCLWQAYEAYRDIVHIQSLNVLPALVEHSQIQHHADSVKEIWLKLGLSL